MCDAFHYLLDNILIIFGSKLYRQIVGIPMGTNYAPLVEDFFCFVMRETLLQQGISEPIFYGDLVYKFQRIVGKSNFSDQFKKIVKRYIRVGYNLDIMPGFKPNHGL